jgi:hypothetical protein
MVLKLCAAVVEITDSSIIPSSNAKAYRGIEAEVGNAVKGTVM